MGYRRHLGRSLARRRVRVGAMISGDHGVAGVGAESAAGLVAYPVHCCIDWSGCGSLVVREYGRQAENVMLQCNNPT